MFYSGTAQRLRESESEEDQAELSKLQEELVLPLHVERDIKLKMAPLAECTFCDQEWLRQGESLLVVFLFLQTYCIALYKLI